MTIVVTRLSRNINSKSVISMEPEEKEIEELDKEINRINREIVDINQMMDQFRASRKGLREECDKIKRKRSKLHYKLYKKRRWGK